MKKIINLRGGNGTGKTTIVREFIKKHSFTTETIPVTKEYKSDITLIDGGKIIACGKYDEQGCVGADRYKGGKQLIPTIQRIIKVYNPDVIIYEGYIYSTIAGLNKKIVQLGRDFGYEWVGIHLIKDLEKQAESIVSRNGGAKAVDYGTMQERNDRITRACRNMQLYGASMKDINVTNLDKAAMGGILEQEIS